MKTNILRLLLAVLTITTGTYLSPNESRAEDANVDEATAAPVAEISPSDTQHQLVRSGHIWAETQELVASTPICPPDTLILDVPPHADNAACTPLVNTKRPNPVISEAIRQSLHDTLGSRATPTNNDAIEAAVREYFADTPIMIPIAECESTFRHYDENGNVLRGLENPKDIGVMQINLKHHQEIAVEMGFNVFDFRDNMAYASHLYETQGAQPWNASRGCWGETQVANR